MFPKLLGSLSLTEMFQEVVFDAEEEPRLVQLLLVEYRNAMFYH